ncbi:unnamed protein product [Adineta steineri]|uniref:Carrier domain-containing protein n=1 Tax=Adineta steineri TaxID=433720 RepID=A0A815FI10_9BILA|nr:unnamed protein product [Adineta steineri]CAF1323710.1 unnamed protein product [Adineta steineri]
MFSRTKVAAAATKGSTVQKEQRLTISGRSEATASFGQQRIWFHEQLYFYASDLSVYNIVVPLIIKQGSVSIQRLQSALRSVIEQHTVLRTAVRFNPTTSQVEQYIQPVSDDIYLFQHSRGISTAEQLDDLLTDESIRKHFDVETGRVVKCHLVERGDENHGHSLHENDLIVFTIHHIAIDLSSARSFVKAFKHAYWIDAHHQSTLLVSQYIDFAQYEQAMLADTNFNSKMNKARRFWSDLMHGYDWNRIRSLAPNEIKHDQTRSGRGYSTVFIFDQRVVDNMMMFASSNNITMFSLSFAAFYAFLFKLLNDEDDLCVASVVANRFNPETKEMIGMFVNILPYRIQVEPNKSFNHFVRKVQQLSTDILEHASLPYQEIIGLHDKQKHQRLPSTFFQYVSLMSSATQKTTVESTIDKDLVIGVYYDRDQSRGNGLTTFDMAVTIEHEHHARTTECVIDCAVEIFQSQAIVNQLANCFQYMLTQLFCSSMIDEPMYKLSIVLSNDENLMYQFGNTHVASSDSCTSTIQECSTIENQISMTDASMFWLDTLYDCHLDQPLSLPFDRYRLANEQRTGRGTSVSFDFGQDPSHHFLMYASSNNIKHEHLALAIYYVYLFKLTNGENDICISMNIDNRYKDELKSIIGLFENIIPLRCQLDPHWSSQYLLDYVREMATNNMKYSYFPLQRILNQHPNVSKPAFLDISFQFLSSIASSDKKQITIGDSQLSSISPTMDINDNGVRNKYDFSLLIQHDLDINQLSCTINASLDLFNVETIDKISQRFHSILNQLFTSVDNQMIKQIYEISLSLPNEILLMQSMNNTQVSLSSPVTCIHHAFICQVMKHPQKLAVELDEQSLTYCELLYYVQVLSLHLINKYAVVSGDVVCQCVERSLSMVIGIMGIEMAGCVYCPLSPRDPQHRLHALTQQTQSRLVFVHHLTKTKFADDIISLDIDSILNINYIDKKGLLSVIVKGKEIAYIIFTSGSTGTPKAVQVRHKNFIDCMHSLAYINSFNKDDTVVQMTRCSFDIHVQEILGILLAGGTLIMLHPGGTIDFDYLSERMFIVVGEPFSVPLIDLIIKIDITNCIVWNLYGPAETTIDCTVYNVNVKNDTQNISIGTPLCNYRCIIMNQYLQSSVTNQEGELFVGGVGVFAGYLGRDDLTANALIEIDSQLFYRTGDLVRMDNNGLLHYQGRKDYQIKLHGQRIELGEIERCLLSITSISACVVMKWNDDYLVAYVQSSYINEEQLRQHCQSHLPPHMIPSIFIILDKLPLNPNGKIDRKQLPPPHFSSTHLTNTIELLHPTNDIEVSIHRIWCEILKQNQISTDTNIFAIGGHSLLIMQLFHQYKIEFHLEQKQSSFSISDLFQQPTIIHHAQLIQQSINSIHTLDDYPWSSLHLTQARASFAQERIFLDEQIRFPSKHHNFMYVIPLVYRIASTNNHLSINRLRRALHTVVAKHRVLRTGFYLDINGKIIQHCLDINATIKDQEPYGFSVVNINSHVEIDEVIKKIMNRSDLFDLSKGRVLSCHIVHRHDFSNLSYNGDTLVMGDLIIFLIHHIVFDGASVSTFLNDLSFAYTNDCMLHVDENAIQYIDSTVYERLMDMTQPHDFWYSQLKDYNFTRSLSLPVDRYCLSTDYRSGLHFVTEICFDDDISTAFLEYITLHHITPFQLAMSIFYAFLYKLTDGQDDLCFSGLHASRYRTELQNAIGIFVATLPFRIQINSQWPFESLVKHVQANCLSIFQHTHYPLQHILADFRRNYSNVSFLDILFEFITVSPNINKFSLDGSNLEEVFFEQLDEATFSDVDVMFVYNRTDETDKLLCRVYGSRDLFDETTVNKIGRKLQAVFSQIFTSKSRVDQIDKLSLVLPDEVELMQNVTFHHLSDINNKDYQIKLHGQRIELGEIEQCLLNTSISACVVMKWDDDRLIAYVESCDMTEKELFEYCQSHLPFHMIPSMFIILAKLPRNDNGTVDQDLLRKSHLSTLIKTDSSLLLQLEARLSHIFSQVLGCESPDVTQPFSEMGGTSLDVLRMLSLIQKDICPIINGSHLFANPSIQKLARTIESLLAISNKITLPSIESTPLTPFVPLRVAIIGCGIGGLSAAIALRRHGHEVTIYEHAHFASEVGASVSVAANGTKFLEEWGINTVAGRSVILQKLIMRNWTDGTINDVYNLSDYKEKWGYVYNTFHRTDLHEQLHIKAKALGVMIVIDHKAIDVDCVNRTVTFDTGSTISVDLIIGADGIRSTVRSLIGIVAKTAPYTSDCYHCIIPTSRVKQLGLKDFASDNAIEFWGDFGLNKIVLVPCCAGEIISFYCFYPASYNHQSGEDWNFSATPSMLLECFPNLDSDLLAIFEHCEDIKLWKLFIHEPYPYWVKGCVALLGDAAHPMLPNQSQGACMAIEDAAAIGIIFSPKYWGNKIFTVEHGLKIYELLRKTRATRVQEASSRVPENFNERIDWNSQRNHDNQQSATTILTMDEINAYDMEKHLDDLLN